MPTYTFTQSQKSDSANTLLQTYGAHDTVAFDTPWVRFANCDICAQVSGDASAVVAVVQRSDTNPAGPLGANAAPADTDGFSGSPADGIPPNIYAEPGVGWWRMHVTTVTDGTVYASLSGSGG